MQAEIRRSAPKTQFRRLSSVAPELWHMWLIDHKLISVVSKPVLTDIHVDFAADWANHVSCASARIYIGPDTKVDPRLPIRKARLPYEDTVELVGYAGGDDEVELVRLPERDAGSTNEPTSAQMKRPQGEDDAFVECQFERLKRGEQLNDEQTQLLDKALVRVNRSGFSHGIWEFVSELRRVWGKGGR